MGAYLSQAVTDKESSDGENEHIKFGTSAMQGWRVGMEDAHSAILDLDDKDTSFFAVFDGHGGKEVAKFCSLHLHQEVLKSEAYAKGDLCESLISAFLRMDELMMEDKARDELAVLAAGGEPSYGGEAPVSKGPMKDPGSKEQLVTGSNDQITTRTGESDGRNKEISSRHEGGCEDYPDSSSREENPTGVSPSDIRALTDRVAVEEGEDGIIKDLGGVERGECGGAGGEKSGRFQEIEDVNGAIEQGNKEESAQGPRNVDEKNVAVIREGVSPGDGDLVPEGDDDDDDDYVEDGDEEEDNEEDEEEDNEDEEEDSAVMVDAADFRDRVGPSKYQGPLAGCTAVVALVRGDKLVVANAGDSRCVISRNGQACDMSMDHKPDLKAERERILNAGGFVKEGRINASLNLSRAIGDMEYKQNRSLPPSEQIVTAYPEVRVAKLVKGDEFMILACDGVWDVMPSQRAVDFVRARLKVNRSLSSIIEELFDTCLAPDTTKNGLGCDNMTCVIVLFKQLISDHSYQGDTMGVFRSIGRYSLRPRSFHSVD